MKKWSDRPKTWTEWVQDGDRRVEKFMVAPPLWVFEIEVPGDPKQRTKRLWVSVEDWRSHGVGDEYTCDLHGPHRCFFNPPTPFESSVPFEAFAPK